MVTFCQLFVLSCRWLVALSVSFSGVCKAFFNCIAYACGTGKIRRAGFSAQVHFVFLISTKYVHMYVCIENDSSIACNFCLSLCVSCAIHFIILHSTSVVPVFCLSQQMRVSFSLLFPVMLI